LDRNDFDLKNITSKSFAGGNMNFLSVSRLNNFFLLSSHNIAIFALNIINPEVI
jgi:hypothetical protein